MGLGWQGEEDREKRVFLISIQICCTLCAAGARRWRLYQLGFVTEKETAVSRISEQRKFQAGRSAGSYLSSSS